jgi:hypothetical protein
MNSFFVTPYDRFIGQTRRSAPTKILDLLIHDAKGLLGAQ